MAATTDDLEGPPQRDGPGRQGAAGRPGASGGSSTPSLGPSATCPRADPVTACPGVPDEGDVSAIDGNYRTWVTEQDLRGAGVTDARQIRDNTGRFTWILDDGVWTYRQRADHFAMNTDDSGFYEYEDGVFTMYWSTIPDNWTRARITVAEDGSLTFDRIVDGRDFEQALSEGFFGSRPWTRVGDPPG